MAVGLGFLRGLLGVATLGSVVLWGGGSLAAPPTEAQAHFDTGLADMLKSRYDTGCPAIAESY